MSWDKEDVYDNEISPLMEKIIEICKKHEMPLVFTCQYCDREDEGPGYCSTMLPFDHESEAIKKLNVYWNNQRVGESIALAETHVTNPDGTKTIRIRRV